MEDNGRVNVVPTLKRQGAFLEEADAHRKWPCEETDHWSTPAVVWRDLVNIIPGDQVLWDPCYNEGRSKIYLEDLGFKVHSKPVDLFKEKPAEWDVIVTNPPFSNMEAILEELFNLNKPMVLLLPSKIWEATWFRKLVEHREVEVKEINLPIRFIRAGKQARRAIMSSIWVFVDTPFLSRKDKPE